MRRKHNPIGYNIGGFKAELHKIYPKWMTKACDRISDKTDNEPLTNTETDALIRYLHGDQEMEKAK